MADDPQKHLLSLIRGFASEKSQGERRVSALKKQVEELQSELDAFNAELENAKLSRELAEQELRGLEVESAVNESTIRALVGRISKMNQEMSVVQSMVNDVKNDSAAIREEFITKMSELNESVRSATLVNCTHGVPVDAILKPEKLPDELAQLISETEMEEESILSMLDTQRKVREELVSVERKVSLMEAVKEAMKNLEDLTSSQLMREISGLGEELQKKIICPSCHQDNIEVLGAILDADGEGLPE